MTYWFSLEPTFLKKRKALLVGIEKCHLNVFFKRKKVVFIPIFILLTCIKATNALCIGQAITSSATGGVNIMLSGCFSFIKIRMKFISACQDRQAGESAVKCLSQRTKQIGVNRFSAETVSITIPALVTI